MASLREEILLFRLLWCMHCLRTSVLAFSGSSAAFFIDCQYAHNPSVLCYRCSRRKSHCHRPAEGMRGDAWDLSSIIKWADFFWEPPTLDSTQPVWTNDFKNDVNTALVKLAKAFDNAERNHRKQHRIGSEKTEPSHAAQYQKYLQDRYTTYPNPLPRPLITAAPDVWDQYNAESGQRLRDGDAGHFTWSVGMRDFLSEVQQAAIDQIFPRDSKALRLLQQELVGTFTVTIQRILSWV